MAAVPRGRPAGGTRRAAGGRHRVLLANCLHAAARQEHRVAVPAGGGPALPGNAVDGAFRYTKKILAGDAAVLEFETTVDRKYVNGVDIIRCDEAGRIVEFRVMIRPLQAVNAVHEQMRAALSSMQP
jgi:hypothetical protein